MLFFTLKTTQSATATVNELIHIDQMIGHYNDIMTSVILESAISTIEYSNSATKYWNDSGSVVLMMCLSTCNVTKSAGSNYK